MILAFENGAKVTPVDGLTSNCVVLGTESLNLLISSTTQKIESLMLRIETIDYERLPPPTLLLVYKTASVVTKRLWIESEKSEGMRRLKILRDFLKAARKRWLCCGELYMNPEE